MINAIIPIILKRKDEIKYITLEYSTTSFHIEPDIADINADSFNIYVKGQSGNVYIHDIEKIVSILIEPKEGHSFDFLTKEEKKVPSFLD